MPPTNANDIVTLKTKKQLAKYKDKKKWIYYGILFYCIFILLGMEINYSRIDLFFRVFGLLICVKTLFAVYKNDFEKIMELIKINFIVFSIELLLDWITNKLTRMSTTRHDYDDRDD